MNLKKFSLVFTLLVLSLLVLSVLSTVSASSIVVTDESSINNTSNSLILNEYNNEYNGDSADSKSIHSITEDNYYDYFKDAGFIDGNNYSYYNESNLINSDVLEGDTLDLSGVFKNKSFVFDKPLNIISSKGCYLYDCQIAFINIKNSKNPNYTNISSLVSNLTIENHVDGKTAIMSMNSSNIIVSENNIYSTGTSAYPIFLSRGTTDSKVLNNIIKTTIGQGGAWQHPGILLGGSDYNYIAGNDVTVEDSNGIYLSEYSGGISNHNIVFNNTVRSSIYNPSSWAYGINLMGDFNTALNNTVIGTYRGISTSGNNNSIIGNIVYNATGAFYEGSVGDSLVGGDYIIYASYNSLVANNSIINSRVAGAAIALCDNSTAYGNNIEITTNNYGIRVFGSNCEIYENNINFLNGTGIYSAIKLDNLKIFNNTINSVKDIDSFSTFGTGNGLPIYINYQSSSKRPTNVFVSGNDIFTSKKTGIDLSRCDNKTLKYIEDNNLNGALVVLPAGYDGNSSSGGNSSTNNTNSSIGETYYVNENNFNEFFVNGNLASKVNDGDTLIFTGKFSSKGQLNIDKRVKIIGKNQNTLAEFVNTTFCISASGVFIDGVKIINSNYNPKNPNESTLCNDSEFNSYNMWGIKIVGANNVTVTNCNISITDKNTSYGIYVFDSIGDTFTYNTIRTEGDYLTYSIVGNEFYNSTIAYNNITTIGTGNLHDYQSSVSYDGEHSVGEMSKTYGIVMVYSSNNNISKNNVYVSSDIKKQPSEFNESTNTLIGIDLYYGSDNNLVNDNKVVVEGKDPFIYGLGVVGALIDEKLPGSYNNSFVNNDVLLNGTYFSSGIIVGNQAIGTLLKNNTLNLYAFNYTYGITLEMSQKSNLISNKINGNGRANYGIELFSSNNNVIKSNYVYGGGEYAESMGFYGSSNNTVKNNTLISNGTHIYNSSSSSKNNHHYDSTELTTVNSGVFETHGTFSNWVSSLNESNYRQVLNFFSNIYNKKDSSNKDFTGLSDENLKNWFNSLDDNSKLEILSLLDKARVSPLMTPNILSDWNQNIYHPDAVDMWNTNVWLESTSEGNVFEDNAMVSNNKNPVMGDGSSTNNKFEGNGLFYGVSKFMSKYYKNQNSNSNSNNQNSNLNSGNIYINGSSQNNGASLDGKSQGMSKVGDLNGVSGESSGVSYSTYELNSMDKASAAYTIPFIILVLVILFCYGFLRKDEDE